MNDGAAPDGSDNLDRAEQREEATLELVVVFEEAMRSLRKCMKTLRFM